MGAAVATALSPAAQSEPPPAKVDPTSAQVVAQEFEAFFLAQVLNQMFAGISTNGAFGGGVAEGVFHTMLNEEYAKIIGRAGGVGVADTVHLEILRLQELE